jgi:hypothetical protein
LPNANRFGELRRSTLSWCRRTRISASNAARDRNSQIKAHQINLQRSLIGSEYRPIRGRGQPFWVCDRDRVKNLLEASGKGRRVDKTAASLVENHTRKPPSSAPIANHASKPALFEVPMRMFALATRNVAVETAYRFGNIPAQWGGECHTLTNEEHLPNSEIDRSVQVVSSRN